MIAAIIIAIIVAIVNNYNCCYNYCYDCYHEITMIATMEKRSDNNDNYGYGRAK